MVYGKHLSDKYYEIKKNLINTNNSNEFDLVINCGEFKKNGEVCDGCFNTAIIKKMQEINSLKRIDFINYQLNKYDDKLDWLKRTLALINDNEEEFSDNSKIYLEYEKILRNGIYQLSDKKTETNTKTKSNNIEFINSERINQLKGIKNNNFDFCKLIKYCDEINFCYQNECYLAVAMLTRAKIDHIPPIFNVKNFTNVYGQNGTQSFKDNMSHLDKSLRKIADSYLHTHIRNKEILPNITQVNFSQNIDVLLEEICRKLK